MGISLQTGGGSSQLDVSICDNCARGVSNCSSYGSSILGEHGDAAQERGEKNFVNVSHEMPMLGDEYYRDMAFTVAGKR